MYMRKFMCFGLYIEMYPKLNSMDGGQNLDWPFPSKECIVSTNIRIGKEKDKKARVLTE